MHPKLCSEEYQYYKAHLSLESFGLEGQLKLKQAKVLIVGVGGLGSPCSLYLASAGIGHLGLIDFDLVERSNLQRQIIHSNIEVGYPKIISAKKRISEMNPYIDLKVYDEKLSLDNIEKIFSEYDFIVDGSDNFETKYLIGDACYFLKKTLVTASVSQFEGQITAFVPGEDKPCYRCLFPHPPEVKMKNCSEQGAYSIAPALLGTLQANEILKSILNIGNGLDSKLILVNPLTNLFKTIDLTKDPECPLCGLRPSITKISKIKAQQQSCHILDRIGPEELNTWKESGKEFLLLDVREPFELEIAHIGGLNIPLRDLDKKITDIGEYKEKEIVVHCHHGARSETACKILLDHQFLKVKNLSGGIDKWSQDIDSSIQRY